MTIYNKSMPLTIFLVKSELGHKLIFFNELLISYCTSTCEDLHDDHHDDHYDDHHDDHHDEHRDELVYPKRSVFFLLAVVVVQVGVEVITVMRALLHLKRLSKQLAHLLGFLS